MKKFNLFLLTLFACVHLNAQVSKTANVTTAGTLATVASSYLTTVTNLTVTGTIDTRDFKTMRDKMPILAVIDISNVKIAAYNGYDGSGNSPSYYADEIPEYSFFNYGNGPSFGKKTLKSIVLPKSATSIEYMAFKNCSAITTVTTGNLVNNISTEAFYGCTSLTSITIPSMVTFIGSWAFSGCTGLTSIYANSTTPVDLGNNISVFDYVDKSLCTLYVPAGSKSLYQSAGQWKDFFNISDGTPSVSSTSISNITGTSASAGGNISNSGLSSVKARGVCWSISANPTISDNKTIDGTGIGNFSSSITGLASATTYHVRAYATNGAGTAYGADVTFTTATVPTAPSVTTTVATAITVNSAIAGGNVISAGTTTVSARGVCWGTSVNPTITNTKTLDGTGSGAFTSTITVPTEGLTYHYRAYATNSVGTAYGSDLTFTTLSKPIVNTSLVSNVTGLSATLGGNITNIGSSAVTARGVCWSTTLNPTILNNLTTEGIGSGEFTSTITGLSMGSTYHASAYATNSVGTAYGADVSFTTLSNSTQVYLNNIAFISLAQDGTQLNVPSTMTMNTTNPNNYVNPGNLVRFKMQCFNNKTNGSNIVSGLCKVRCNDPYITLTDSTSGLNNVGWKAGAWSTDEFEIQIKSNAPLGHVSYVDFIVVEGTSNYYTYQVPIPIAPLSLQSKTVDDDNNPDSKGNGNGICEPNETIESLPTIQNVSSLSANMVSGVFGSFYGTSNINVWDKKLGSSGNVVNNSYWNYSFGAPQAITAGAKDMVPQWDFVFDYNYTNTYHFTMGLALSGTFNLFSGYQSYIKWLVPIEYNTGYPDFNTAIDRVGIEKINVYPNPSNGIFSVNLGSLFGSSCFMNLTNMLGQTVYTSKLTSEKATVNLTSYGLKGLYLLQIINSQGLLLGEKKIVIK